METRVREHDAAAAGRRWRVWGWSALLLAGQGLLGGFYYETNDDPVMELLVRGVTAAEPVRNLHMFLHGWSQVLAGLYTAAPQVPWYGLLLYAMLYLALATAFWAIEMVGAGRLRGRTLLAVETGFYGLTFFLSALQMNFTRPGLLLGAAAGLLLLVPRPAGQSPGRVASWVLAGLALASAWGFRPSAAMLGLALTLPLLAWQGWRRGISVVGGLGGLLLLLTAARLAAVGPDTKAYESFNQKRVQIFDYATAQLEVATPADSLAYLTMMPFQGLNDSVLLSPAFFDRAMHLRTGQRFNLGVYKEPLRLAIGSTALRLPGCLLLVAFGAVVVAAVVRRGHLRLRSWPVLVYVAYQGFFWAIFLVLVPHLPLRVLQPIMTIYLLVNMVLVFGCLLPTARPADLPRWAGRGLALAGVGVAALALVVNGRLVRQLSRDNATQSAYLAHLAATNGPGVLVEQDLSSLYGHLAPFQDHHLGGYRKVLMLTGWAAFDPSQPRLRQALTGTRDLPTALLRLARQPDTRWVMQPTFAPLLGRYLNERLALPAGQRVRFEPVPDDYPLAGLPYPPLRYRLRAEAEAAR